jgi:hypothetical protein
MGQRLLRRQSAVSGASSDGYSDHVFSGIPCHLAGLPADQLLERMIELSLYAEEKLKSGWSG